MSAPVGNPNRGGENIAANDPYAGTRKGATSPKERPLSHSELVQRRRHAEDSLSEDIVEEARVQLMLKFRFLDRALWRMALEPVRGGMAYAMGTDGRRIYHDPQRVIARFRQSFDETVRDYLHMVTHCIFRHPYDKIHKNEEAWSLTCDMIVESVVMDLCGERFPSKEDALRKGAIDEVTLAAGSFLPNKVYDFLKSMVLTPEGSHHGGMGRGRLNEWHRLFERDDHAAWPCNAREDGDGQGEDGGADDSMVEDDENPDFQNEGLETETLGSDESGQEESRSQGGEDQPDIEEGDESPETVDEDAQDAADGMRPQSSENGARMQDLDRREWEELAKEIEMNLETFSKEWGEESGSLIANLSLANRKTYNYTDFLRKFMSITEQMRLNPEEFDYTYYTFGMDMYGNMPFIEPLEYKETDAIREFAIAVDTSESVSGPLVKKFIEHTFSILKESEDFSRDVNIHVIQADSKVQSDLKINDVADVDKILNGGNFAIRGLGGTDFRPTFDYIEMLQAAGEFDDLKGMIYFTDGIGQFPEKMPDYDVAFVFVDDGSRELPPVPPWAIKIVLDDQEIGRLS